MLNRIAAPEFKQVEHIEFLRTSAIKLKNGIEVFVLNAGEQELVRIEFFFRNVNWDVNQPLAAFAANTMLNDGTKNLTAAQIAEKVDYYGAFFQTEYNYDHSTVTLYTLNKHLASTLPIIKDVLTGSCFPEKELATFIQNQQQKLSVNLEKNDFVARKLFNKALFGDSLYGFEIKHQNYDALTQQEIISYFKQAYQPANCTIIASGKVDDAVVRTIDDVFGAEWTGNNDFSPNSFQFGKGTGAEHLIEKPEALQSAIRMGALAINRNHADFAGLQVLNTVLGGYFGSRLMANIREDKGYTYGIGSGVVSMMNAGYFYIATEVGADVCSSALNEIEKEINLLKTELVGADELNLVRNYMLGSMLGGLENAFSHADKFKNVHFYGLDHSYYDNYIHTVKTISSESLLALANTYLNVDRFEKVIVGKK